MEPQALSKLIAWRKGLCEEIRGKTIELSEQLKAVIPMSLAKWLEKDGNTIIDFFLLNGGSHYRKYFQWQPKDYGFNNLEEFGQGFEELREAWKTVVDIQMNWDRPDFFFLVTFTAI